MDSKENLNFCLNIITGFCLVGVWLAIVNPAQIAFSYSWISISLLAALTIIWALITPEMMNMSWISVLLNIFSNSMPIVIIIILLSWVVSIYTNNAGLFNEWRDNTNVGVPGLFSDYQRAVSYIVILEVLLVIDYIKNKFLGYSFVTDKESIIGKIYNTPSSSKLGMLYLIICIHYILVANMDMIIKYFIVDG